MQLLLNTVTCCLLRLSKCPKRMKFLFASQKFLNRPIQDFLICKKQKRRQEKHRFNLLWKGFVQEPWQCSVAMNLEKLRHYYCLLYTSDAADEEDSVDLGGRR